MIKINLLPQHARASTFPIVKVIVLGAVGSLSICLAAFFYVMFSVWQVENQLNDLQNRQILLQKVAEKRVIAQNKLAAVKKRETLLAEVSQERKPWSEIVTHLTSLTTSKVWFVRLGLEDKEKKNNIKITGMIQSYPDLAEFVKKLENDEMFVAPSIAVAEKNIDPQQPPITRFEILVQLRELKK